MLVATGRPGDLRGRLSQLLHIALPNLGIGGVAAGAIGIVGQLVGGAGQQGQPGMTRF